MIYGRVEELAGEIESHKHGHSIVPPQTKPEGNQEDRPKAKVGDLVLWCSGGVDQFSTPRRVNWISEDGNHVRVFGSMTVIPMGEVQVVEPPKVPPLEKRAASAYAGGDGELNVLLTNGRLQITADVDLAGLERLKDVLVKYEEILQLLA